MQQQRHDMRGRTLYHALFLIPLLFLAACGGDEPKIPMEDGTELDVASPTYATYQILKASGNKVEIKGLIQQPFFEPRGTVLTINGSDVQVFEFPTNEATNAAAATVSPDGSQVGMSKMTLLGPPHFYKAAKVIVIYMGDDAQLKQTLEATVGPQFAGQP